MKKLFKNRFLGMILAIIIMIAFTSNTHAWIKLNYSENGFDETGKSEIEEMIITGASNFLSSYSHMLIIFNEIELRGLNPINYKELQLLIGQSIYCMENARDAYVRLYQKALNTPYNADMINKLMDFDYSVSLGWKSSREGTEDVTTFLQRGDIRGIYNSTWLNVEKILDELHFLKHSFDNGAVPELRSLWDLHQSYSDSLLSGQYVAKVFYKITGK